MGTAKRPVKVPAKKTGKHAPGKRVKGKQAGSPHSEAVMAEAITAYTYRIQGYTFHQIAEAIGKSVTRSAELVKIGREAMIREPAEELIQMQIDRCNALISAAMPFAMKGDPQSMGQVRQLMQQLDSYHDMGMSKPNETKTSVKNGDQEVVVQSVTRRIIPAEPA